MKTEGILGSDISMKFLLKLLAESYARNANIKRNVPGNDKWTLILQLQSKK